MHTDTKNTLVAGIIFISTFAISNIAYADSYKNESDIKKLQDEIKTLQQTQTKMAKELNILNQTKISIAYNDDIDASTRRVGSRGSR